MSKKCETIHKWFNSQQKFRFPFDEYEIPPDGIYVLFEKGETAHGTNRIIRIGTHDGEGRLAVRLKDHFLKDIQRNSIFRKHVGRCFLNKENNSYLKYWNLPFKSVEAKEKYKDSVDLEYEKKYEKKISKYIQQNLFFVIIPGVKPKKIRKRFESRLISTISLCKDCSPSKKWLGLSHPEGKIRESGLWNINELYKEILSNKDMQELRRLLKTSD